jgi:hypothetical protein
VYNFLAHSVCNIPDTVLFTAVSQRHCSPLTAVMKMFSMLFPLDAAICEMS